MLRKGTAATESKEGKIAIHTQCTLHSPSAFIARRELKKAVVCDKCQYIQKNEVVNMLLFFLNYLSQ